MFNNLEFELFNNTPKEIKNTTFIFDNWDYKTDLYTSRVHKRNPVWDDIIKDLSIKLDKSFFYYDVKKYKESIDLLQDILNKLLDRSFIDNIPFSKYENDERFIKKDEDGNVLKKPTDLEFAKWIEKAKRKKHNTTNIWYSSVILIIKNLIMLNLYDDALNIILDWFPPIDNIEDEDYLIIISYIYYKKEDYVKAIQITQKMLSNKNLSFSINIHIFLANCFLKLKKYENSIYTLQSFVDYYKINPYDNRDEMLKI